MASTTRRLVKALDAKQLLSNFWHRETTAARSKVFNGLPKPTLPPRGSKLPIPIANPFLPILNESTRRWRPAKYSRRRQADLVKAARLLGVESHLPLGPKGQRPSRGMPEPSVNLGALKQETENRPVQWLGKPPPINEKGLYGTRRFMFKGHKWERERPEREKLLHTFKVKHDQKRRVLTNRMWKMEQKAEKERIRRGILL
ncbi:hypothetical protein BS47DRAFT_1367331 [Hydnum rufescens UP504]|uniref:Large ribosomal subunit protein mL59 domain-containing protein n=1 Tax=Hydnum rufescens UP504 TaxID=1448309 RepID=A0A9P6AJG9_9AGAM|nr:hypothetical protein BS47DRAFT_1367331 [Hydnum rufescens UP504]